MNDGETSSDTNAKQLSTDKHGTVIIILPGSALSSTSTSRFASPPYFSPFNPAILPKRKIVNLFKTTAISVSGEKKL